MAGEIQGICPALLLCGVLALTRATETSKRRVLRIIEKQNEIEDAEQGIVADPLLFGTSDRPKRYTASIAGMPVM